tara:strand:+ start:1126 stop:1329 length:204 start_codon:yes stop_codon:yes gene_type:complete
MPISKETLKAMIRDYEVLNISDSELDLILPEIENYLTAVNSIEDLDLSEVVSGRLYRPQEGGSDERV